MTEIIRRTIHTRDGYELSKAVNELVALEYSNIYVEWNHNLVCYDVKEEVAERQLKERLKGIYDRPTSFFQSRREQDRADMRKEAKFKQALAWKKLTKRKETKQKRLIE